MDTFTHILLLLVIIITMFIVAVCGYYLWRAVAYAQFRRGLVVALFGVPAIVVLLLVVIANVIRTW